MASKLNGTIYIGVTSDLLNRVWGHRENIVKGFTKRYAVHILVYYELHEEMTSAILREKWLKKWNRSWKFALIEERNPNWEDLYESLY